jgi:hypothetical protein
MLRFRRITTRYERHARNFLASRSSPAWSSSFASPHTDIDPLHPYVCRLRGCRMRSSLPTLCSTSKAHSTRHTQMRASCAERF